MKTDALSRRLRFAPPQPLVKRLVLNEADYLIFEAIHRHGPLPTHYLFEFIRHIRRNYSNLQARLTEFYNGDAIGPYLVRPPQQGAGYDAKYQHVVYDLAPRARQALMERGIVVGPKRADPFLHQLMGACVAASIELGASAKGLRYISRHEILSKAGNALPLQLPGGHVLIPDDVFGLQGSDEKGEWYRFFAVEIDRNTESIERQATGYNTWGKKVANYLALLKGRQFDPWWGMPNLTVLTVTTNAVHARNILDYIAKQNDPLAKRFAFACEPLFGANWRVPRALLSHLLDEPWQAVTGSKDITRP